MSILVSVFLALPGTMTTEVDLSDVPESISASSQDL